MSLTVLSENCKVGLLSKWEKKTKIKTITILTLAWGVLLASLAETILARHARWRDQPKEPLGGRQGSYGFTSNILLSPAP